MAATTRFGGEEALVRNHLASILFRFRHACGDAPEGFDAFEAGPGVRTPLEVVRHVGGLMRNVRRHLEPEPVDDPVPADWAEELTRVERSLAAIDRHLLDPEVRPQGRLTPDQLWRGPLTDALTHIGQLTTLRRLYGAPVESVRYWQVAMPFPADAVDPREA